MVDSRRESTQGGTANKQGRVLEKTIIPTFEEHGFKILAFSDWMKNPDAYGKELVLKNVPYTSIYGHNGKNEFLVQSEKFNLNLRIECKWQQSSGSVDEKYPYLLLNCLEAIPENEVIIIYGGGGMKTGAISWLKTAISSKKYRDESTQDKQIHVFSLEEFILWANKRLK